MDLYESYKKRLLDKKEEIEEEEEIDEEDISLEEIMKRKTKVDEIQKVNLFCKEPTQNNFNNLKKTTREDFIRFANYIIKLNKGNIKLAKIILKLKV